jgi:hypothetical protein
MSSVDVLTKKNLSVRRKIFKVWGRGEKKCVSVKFWVFGKKMKDKVPKRKKKKSKCFFL